MFLLVKKFTFKMQNLTLKTPILEKFSSDLSVGYLQLLVQPTF